MLNEVMLRTLMTMLLLPTPGQGHQAIEWQAQHVYLRCVPVIYTWVHQSIPPLCLTLYDAPFPRRKTRDVPNNTGCTQEDVSVCMTAVNSCGNPKGWNPEDPTCAALRRRSVTKQKEEEDENRVV